MAFNTTQDAMIALNQTFSDIGIISVEALLVIEEMLCLSSLAIFASTSAIEDGEFSLSAICDVKLFRITDDDGDSEYDVPAKDCGVDAAEPPSCLPFISRPYLELALFSNTMAKQSKRQCLIYRL
eukprot:gnl/MRDRNA2_/MRDRNA2_216113_c0_seq1.p1 gnl/MRDRNA2_/MRDRNA2_216113_c0~~gnl/MRDRNA2_/MRDRNA2_216113_c0_seq1.p1  ORF type:complete len:125 (+),score=17.29 gnl/MRDRNA2_/MRDRNA2_216113_c0_seq1:7-381(+)